MRAHRLAFIHGLAVLLLTLVLGLEDMPTASAEDPPEPVLGAPPAFDLSGEQDDAVLVEAGTRLHQDAGPLSPTLTRIDFAAELPVLERRGDWARVRYGQWTGWVLAESGAARADAATAAPETRPSSVPTSGPDPRLERLVEILGADAERASLGPFTLLTDVSARALRADFDRTAAALPEVFQARYGLEPGIGEGTDAGTVALFASEADYLAFVAADEDLAPFARLGHAGGGLAALFVGGRRVEEVRALLVHELVHLLSEDILPASSPSWLIEGLAEDLAWCRVDQRGRPVPGTLYEWGDEKARTTVDQHGETQVVVEVTTGGALHLLEDLRERWATPRRPSLEGLLELPWREFADPAKRRLHYTMSGFFIRYLLADEERQRGFGRFLEVLRSGEPAGPETLRHAIAPEASWAEIEADFGLWLERL